ncbi:MAG: ribonuclease P protein component 1 [Candidatus Methanospirareceae archaeon]
MKITPSNLLQHELIGLKIKIEESSNKNMIGLSGVVVDETRNMLIIEDEKSREKKIPKAYNTFIFELEDGVKVRVRGEMLISRPEDRIKKKIKKR